MTEVARHLGGFVLYALPASGGWVNFKLVRPTGRKRNWRLGWNGKRIAGGKDAKRLQEDEPEVFDWIIDVLEKLGGVTA